MARSVVVNLTARSIPSRRILGITEKALASLGLNGVLEVVITDSTLMRRINTLYRHKRSSTSVLSFPYFSHDSRGYPFVSAIYPRFLGQVFLSLPDVEKRAKKSNRTLPEELTRLLVHAIVHIKGLNHRTERAASRMVRIESEILKRILKK